MRYRRYLQLKEKYPWLNLQRGRFWFGPGSGRYWKRMLSKARRRYIKAIIKGEDHPRTPAGIESMVNHRAD